MGHKMLTGLEPTHACLWQRCGTDIFCRLKLRGIVGAPTGKSIARF